MLNQVSKAYKTFFQTLLFALDGSFALHLPLKFCFTKLWHRYEKVAIDTQHNYRLISIKLYISETETEHDMWLHANTVFYGIVSLLSSLHLTVVRVVVIRHFVLS